MGGTGWTRWYLRDGRLRTTWRVISFVALFVALLVTGSVLLSLAGQVEVPGDRISAGLVAQTALSLLAALLAAWFMLRWVDRSPLRGLGFPLRAGALRELGLGLGVGGLALAGAVAVVAAFGGYRYTSEPGSLVGWATTSGLALAALAIPAAAEEALFRGYLFRALVEGPGAAVAVVLTSVVFAALHGSNPGTGVFALVNIFLAGVFMAVAVLRTGTLWLATGVHLGWNWVMSGPLDLPVSGLQGLDMPMYDAMVVGPGWITGGSFGPEGGLVGTVAAVVGLGLVLRMTRPGGLLGPGRDGRGRDVGSP